MTDYVAWNGETYSGQPPEGWYLAADGRWWSAGTGPGPAAAPPAAPPPATAPTEAGEYVIREEGRNGRVTIEQQGIVRELRKAIGKNDRQFIPYSSIGYVEHDRKSLGSDVVTVHVGPSIFKWKVATKAEEFVDQLNGHLASR